MPKSGGDKQNDKNSEHNHSDFSPINYPHILYHSLRLDNNNNRKGNDNDNYSDSYDDNNHSSIK